MLKIIIQIFIYNIFILTVNVDPTCMVKLGNTTALTGKTALVKLLNVLGKLHT